MGQLLEKIRNWIDGDEPRHLEDMMANVKPASPSMQFIVRIVDAIRADLTSGTYIPSTDISPAYFPPIYYIFLSESDLKNWTGERREHLQSRIAEGVMKKIGELDSRKITQTVRIEVKPDGTLNPGQVRVQPLTETSRTQDDLLSEEKETVRDPNFALPVLYRLAIYENERLLETRDIVNREIHIGRSKVANIALLGDDRIGRRHAILFFDDGTLSIEAVNENPTRIAGEPLPNRHRRTLKDGDRIEVYKFTLVPKL